MKLEYIKKHKNEINFKLNEIRNFIKEHNSELFNYSMDINDMEYLLQKLDELEQLLVKYGCLKHQ